MEIDISANVNKVDVMCRICHCESANMKLLISKMGNDNRTIAEVLSFILNLYISMSEEYPKQVCGECYDIILKFDQFKKRCIELEGSLNDKYYTEGKVEKSEIQVSKSSIKDILSVNKFYLEEPYQCSICTTKFSDVFLLESHVLSEHSYSNELRNKELSLSENIICYPEYAGNTSFYNNANSNDNDNDEDDFKDKKDEQNFDFAESTSNLNVSLIECKEELEVKPKDKIKCKCGAMLDNYDTYRLHVDENNCNKTVNGDIVISNDSIPEKPTKKKSKVCKKCNMEFDSPKRYKLHLHKHRFENLDPSEIFNCPMCMRRFTKESSFNTHLKTHEIKANIKFICNTCKREFQHQAHLDNHILNVHTRETGYNCEYCGKKFATEDSLHNHKDGHKIEKRHQCNFCSKGFFMLSTLRDHIRTHTGEKPFLCSACGKGFSQKNNLAQHMRRHQGLKLFKCEQCDQRFVSKGELVAHTRKHSGAHPFVCDECGNGFTTSSSLVKHRRIHTGERPYACDLCNMKFTASGTLKNHRRIHTGEKPYQCSHCEKAFVQRQDLVSHIRCHTGERPFVCPHCEQSFRKASGLKGHLKIHAKEPMSMSAQKEVRETLHAMPVQKEVSFAVLHGVLIAGVQDMNG